MRNMITIRLLLLICIGCFLLNSLLSQTYNTTVPNVIAPAGVEVNTHTGNMFYQRHEFNIPTIGPDLEIYFSYNSHNTTLNFGYGYGWTMNYNVLYENISDTVIIHREDGRRDSFPNLLGVYYAPPGVFDTLILYDGDKFLLRSKSGLKYYFENPGHKRMTKKVDRNGNTLTLAYVDGLPALVSDATGRIIEFAFTDGLLTQIADPNAIPPRVLAYAYNKGQNQTSTTDPLGHSITYVYDIDRNLVQLKDKRGNTFDLKYTPDGRVSEVNSEMTHLEMSYNISGGQTSTSESVGGVNQVSTFDFDGQGRNTQTTNACCGYYSAYTYDSDNNYTSVENANGHLHHSVYDGNGNDTSSTDPLGNTGKYTYDTVFSQLLTMTDALGNTTTHSYDFFGNRIMTVRPEGVVEEFTYDTQGNMLTSEDGAGQITTYVHDPFGYIIEVHHPIGFETYTYNFVGDMLTHTDANGNISTYSYDPLNRLISEVDELGYTTSYTYDPNGNQITMTNARGFTTEYQYDSYDRLITKITPIRSSFQYEYDARGNLTKRIDPNGHETNYIYDNLNRLVEQSDALFHISNYSYDPVGNRISETDANGHSIRYSYDALNRLIADTSAVGEVTQYAYGATGNIIASLLPNGNQLNFLYDDLNRLYWRFDNALGTTGEYTYDHNSNLVTEMDAASQVTEYKYDAMNRLIETIDPKDDTLFYNYDLNGNLTEVVDMQGRLTSYTYDGLDRRITMLDALGNLTIYEYDEVGNQTLVTDANGNSTEYVYDPLNRLIMEVFSDNSDMRFDYDPAGNLVERRDNNGNVTLYSYDPLNRLIARDYPGSNDDVFTYDPAGLMSSAQNQDALIDFTYDPTNRLLSETLNGHMTEYIYDYIDGGRTIIYPSGRQIQERLNGRYQVDTIKDGSVAIAVYDYDTLGRELGRQCPLNGTVMLYSYDNNNRVVNVNHLPGGIADFNYAYDKMNNRLFEEKLHEPSRSEQYVFDAIDRLVHFKNGPLAAGEVLTPFTQTQYEYDPVGNRIIMEKDGFVTPYSNNNMNAYTLVGQALPVNDSNGNLLEDGNFIYGYDYENRLTEVDSGIISNYSYDPLGRRIDLEIGSRISFYYDGDRVIEEWDDMDNPMASYVYGNGIDEVLNMQRGGGKYFYHQNAIGSVVAITDLIGNVQERYSYDAYGAVEMADAGFNPIPESFIGNPYFFTGRRLDSETGLYYYRARHYDPESGRFLQRDPKGYVDGMNLYEFVMNNPVNMVDPFGQQVDTRFNKHGWWHSRNHKYRNVLARIFVPGGRLPRNGGDLDHTAVLNRVMDYMRDRFPTTRFLRKCDPPLPKNMKRRNVLVGGEQCNEPWGDWLLRHRRHLAGAPNIGWICVEKTSFAVTILRALGYPVRELNIDQGTIQTALFQVWYDGEWHSYDPYENKRDFGEAWGAYGVGENKVFVAEKNPRDHWQREFLNANDKVWKKYELIKKRDAELARKQQNRK